MEEIIKEYMINNKLNIHLFDHIVLGDNRFYSITESKLYDEIEK